MTYLQFCSIVEFFILLVTGVCIQKWAGNVFSTDTEETLLLHKNKSSTPPALFQIKLNLVTRTITSDQRLLFWLRSFPIKCTSLLSNRLIGRHFSTSIGVNRFLLALSLKAFGNRLGFYNIYTRFLWAQRDRRTIRIKCGSSTPQYKQWALLYFNVISFAPQQTMAQMTELHRRRRRQVSYGTIMPSCQESVFITTIEMWSSIPCLIMAIICAVVKQLAPFTRMCLPLLVLIWISCNSMRNMLDQSIRSPQPRRTCNVLYKKLMGKR